MQCDAIRYDEMRLDEKKRFEMTCNACDKMRIDKLRQDEIEMI